MISARVVVAMGSGCEVLDETAKYLNERGEKLGVLQVLLYRPWVAQAFLDAMPKSVKGVVVLDRTKEAGTIGEPLYLDVVTTFGPRYGKVISLDRELAPNATPVTVATAIDEAKLFRLYKSALTRSSASSEGTLP